MCWTPVKYCFRVFSLPYGGMLVTIVSACLMYVDNFTLSTSQRAQDVVLRVFCTRRTQTGRREVIYVSPFTKSAAKLEKKIPPWLFTLASRGALQEWAATCSSAQELSSTLKLVWRIYFGLDLLSPREMYSCWQLECTWCTSFGWIQSNHPRVQFASSEITHDMSLQVYFFTYQIYS